MEGILTDVLLNRREIYDKAIAAWGAFDEDAERAYARVIRKRFRFLASVLRDAGMAKSDAEFKTRLILGFITREIEDRSGSSRAQQLADVKRLCDMVFA